MKIIFWPDFIDEKLEASVSGDVLTINGEKFDFGPIGEGFQLPGVAVGSDWFHSNPITRINGEITVTIKLPVTPDTPESVRNPAKWAEVVVTKGKVPLPDTSAPAQPIPVVPGGVEDGPVPAE